MIRIAIVEDEESYIKQLKGYIDRFSEETGEHFQVTCYTDGGILVEKFKA